MAVAHRCQLTRRTWSLSNVLHSFQCRVVRIWNNIQESVMEAVNLIVFLCRLKRFNLRSFVRMVYWKIVSCQILGDWCIYVLWSVLKCCFMIYARMTFFWPCAFMLLLYSTTYCSLLCSSMNKDSLHVINHILIVRASIWKGYSIRCRYFLFPMHFMHVAWTECLFPVVLNFVESSLLRENSWLTAIHFSSAANGVRGVHCLNRWSCWYISSTAFYFIEATNASNVNNKCCFRENMEYGLATYSCCITHAVIDTPMCIVEFQILFSHETEIFDVFLLVYTAR